MHTAILLTFVSLFFPGGALKLSANPKVKLYSQGAYFNVLTVENNTLMLGAKNAIYSLEMTSKGEMKKILKWSNQKVAYIIYLDKVIDPASGTMRYWLCDTVNKCAYMLKSKSTGDLVYAENVTRFQFGIPATPVANFVYQKFENTTFLAVIKSENRLPSVYSWKGENTNYLPLNFFHSPSSVRFVTMFSSSLYQYIVFREIAIELSNYRYLFEEKSKPLIYYSRIMRLCLTEPTKLNGDNKVSSALKARLLCTSRSLLDSQTSRPAFGFVSHDFDYPLALTQISTNTDSPVTDSSFIGVFASNQFTTNGVKAFAICNFKFADVDRVIDESDFILEQSNSPKYIYTAARSGYKEAGKCVNHTGPVQVPPRPLMQSPVLPADTANALITFTAKYTPTTIAVLRKWLSTQSNVVMDVTLVFLGTESGRLVTILLGNSSEPKIIDDRSVPQTFTKITSLVINKEQTLIVVISTDTVVSLPVHNCEVMSTCSDCIGTLDPFCFWDPMSGVCSYDSNSTEVDRNESSCSSPIFSQIQGRIPIVGRIMKSDASTNTVSSSSSQNTWIILLLISNIIFALLLLGMCCGPRHYVYSLIDCSHNMKCKVVTPRSRQNKSTYSDRPASQKLKNTSGHLPAKLNNQTSSSAFHHQKAVDNDYQELQHLCRDGTTSQMNSPNKVKVPAIGVHEEPVVGPHFNAINIHEMIDDDEEYNYYPLTRKWSNNLLEFNTKAPIVNSID